MAGEPARPRRQAQRQRGGAARVPEAREPPATARAAGDRRQDRTRGLKPTPLRLLNGRAGLGINLSSPNFAPTLAAMPNSALSSSSGAAAPARET